MTAWMRRALIGIPRVSTLLRRRRRRPRGHIDQVKEGAILGWAYNPDAPGQRAEVEFLLDGVVVGRVRADMMRADLAQHGIGDGRHAFAFDLASVLCPDRGAQNVRARIVGGPDLRFPGIVVSAADMPAARAGAASTVTLGQRLLTDWMKPLPCQGIVSHALNGGTKKIVCGHYQPAEPSNAAYFRHLRPDEDFPAKSPDIGGFVFDATLDSGDAAFGWEGCLTPANNLANRSLARHLMAASAENIPSVLIYRPETLTRVFFADFAPRFTHVKQSQEGGMDDRLMKLVGISRDAETAGRA